MNAFLHLHNKGPSLTGTIGVTAHSTSLFQENEPPKNIIDIFLPKSDISFAEPYDVQLAELGDNIITMYQIVGDINDTKAGGLESLFNYMNENFFGKYDPAFNGHHYHITKKQHNEEIHSIYNVGKSKALNIKNNEYFN